MKLARLLLDPEPSPIGRVMAWELAETYAAQEAEGLPSHMRQAVRQAAWAYLEGEDWVNHLQLCLLLVQARTGAQEPSEVQLRLEMESILMDILYGPIV